MNKLTKIFGGWVLNVSVIEGTITYCLAFLHPVFFLIQNRFNGRGWDPYVVFINACLFCNTPTNLYYTLGMISFWLLTIVFFVGVFKHYNLWFKKNWRKFTILNYVVFLVAGAHAFLIGTDFKVKPFYYFAVIAYAIIVGIVVFVEIPRLYRNFRNWLTS